MSHTLTTYLREGTQQSHTLAENTAFMKCFLQGIVAKEALRQLMSTLYFVYDALEGEMQNYAEHPVVGSLYFPRLERTSQLEKDLAFYYGDNWRNEVQVSRKGLAYIVRLRAVANDDPTLLIAHAYVRYMDNLSGGQRLKAIIRSMLALPEGSGTAFYEFEGMPTGKEKRVFKQHYRDTLDTLPLSEKMVSKIVEEANVSCQLNRDVMNELEPLVRAAMSDETFERITRQDNPRSTTVDYLGHLTGLMTRPSFPTLQAQRAPVYTQF